MKTLLIQELESISKKILLANKELDTSENPFAYAAVLNMIDQQKDIMTLLRHYL